MPLIVMPTSRSGHRARDRVVSGEPRGGPAASDDRGHLPPASTWCWRPTHSLVSADRSRPIGCVGSPKPMARNSSSMNRTTPAGTRTPPRTSNGCWKRVDGPDLSSATYAKRPDNLSVYASVLPELFRQDDLGFLLRQRRRAVAGGVLADAGRGRRADPARARSVSHHVPHRTGHHARTAIGNSANRLASILEKWPGWAVTSRRSSPRKTGG